MNGELFLTAYTILSQASIGLIFMIWVGSLLAGKEPDSKKAYKIFLVAAVLSLIAMGISAMHLGSPFRAMNSLGNLANSWLSREILLTNLFFLTTAGGVYLSGRGSSIKLPLLAGSILGGLCVLCQAAIYAHTVYPAWSNGHAYVTFFTATLIMGAFLAVAFLPRGEKATEGNAKILLVYTLAALAAIIAAAGFYAVFSGLLAQSGTAGHKSLILLSDYSLLMTLRWLCSIIALAGLGIAAYRRAVGGSLAFFILLAIIGEASNRLIFYSIAAGAGL